MNHLSTYLMPLLQVCSNTLPRGCNQLVKRWFLVICTIIQKSVESIYIYYIQNRMELKLEYAKYLLSAMLSDSMYTGKVFGFTMQRIVCMCCLIQVVFSLIACVLIDRS